VAGKTERLQLRISPDDRAQVVATGQDLGLNLSSFVRMAVLERVELEQVFRRADDQEDGETE
jgi:uncharacterized protein (DUF1778 family)